MIRLIFILAMKDWRLFWSDRRAALLSFLVPIILASVFGIIFDKPQSQDNNIKLPIIIVAEDDSTFTQAVVADLLASDRTEATLMSREQATHKVADRRPGIAVIFPHGFDATAKINSFSNDKQISTDNKPRLELIHNPLCTTESQWAEGILTEIIMKRVAKTAFGMKDSQADFSVPFKIVKSATTGEHANFNSYAHSFSGMTLQYLLFWGMESGLLFLRERNRCVWQRTRSSPVPFYALILGKTLSMTSIAILQSTLTFLFGRLVFGVNIGGSWAGFALLVISISLLSAATGLAVAAIGGTESRARSVTILVILGVSMLGGLWVPAFLLPNWARDFSLALPTTWAMRGLDGATWQGLPFQRLLPYIGVVLLFAIAFLSLATVRLIANEKAKQKGQLT